MRNAQILIVDDEANIRLMLKTALESEGYVVREASNGQEALEAISVERPDLALLDLSMPVMDGMAVLEKLHDEPASDRPRVIVLTAYGSIAKAVKAVRLGASDFLEKPATPEDVRLSVASVLAESREEPPARESDLGYSEILATIRDNLWRGDFRHAEALLMRAADLAGSDPSYYNLLGVLHEAEGRPKLAKRFYGKAIHANRKYEPAQQNMQRLYELERFGRTAREVSLGGERDLLDEIRGTRRPDA